MDSWVLGSVVLVFAVSIIGIFFTKTPGFGRYTTSVLVLTLVLFVAALAFVNNKVEWEPLANLLFAVAGFAGGLIVAEKPS
jgi:hypothetical protein